MRTLLILSMALPSVALGQADYVIPQCERAHNRCMKRTVDVQSAFVCRKARKWCRTAAIEEATKNAQQPRSDGRQLEHP
jgi:hypothetical protein